MKSRRSETEIVENEMKMMMTKKKKEIELNIIKTIGPYFQLIITLSSSRLGAAF